MNKSQLQNEILAMIKMVFEDEKELEKIHAFLLEEIYQEPEPEKIPEKYKKVVSSMADSLISGLICYFNPDTLEFEDIPAFMIDPDEYELRTGEPEESIEFKYKSWTNFVEIEPLESYESFKIMEYFVNEVSDTGFQNKLINALNRRKPFGNFKYLVENSDYRQQWFDFRQAQYEQYVWNSIELSVEFKS